MRLFFALVPDEALRSALGARARDLARTIDGRAVPAHNVHLTLVFLGEIDRARMPALRAILDATPRDAFTLTLDCVGQWHGAGVAWIAPRVVPAPLAALHAALNDALHRAGFPVETRPFRPHITLVRRQSRALADAPAEPLTWRVERLSLMRSESVDGAVRYREDTAVALS
jgi:RNA 2',3'-cyclic 3'-phosphodiesterase